jgi:uncharacterized repeat protein (TIGR01451 family)/fimbrial isopeptide formation D2 family protein
MFSRFIAAFTTTALLSVGMVAGISVATADAADPDINLSATSQSFILAGEAATITLSANNFSVGTDLYNASFNDVLPPGVSYTGGSTVPSTIGDPQVITVVDNTNPLLPVSHQVLVWSNVSDLVAANSSSISFGVMADPTVYPVGSTYSTTANVYAQSDPRLLPKFDSSGAVVLGSYTNSDTANTTLTQVSAIKIVKSNPNPESELMRGVHNQSSTFTLKVSNTNQGATNGVIVDDFLPASLEFLGCGGVDNSTGREYTGAASLSATPTPSNCVTPFSVDTVNNPAGYPSGVYTKIEWHLGNFAASQTQTITYAVGIPIYPNTMTFTGGTPSATSLGQTANLNNNTPVAGGTGTRQINAGQSYTNNAVASGTYQGQLFTGASASVSSSDTNTVKSMDLAVEESASTNTFVAGGNFTYDLKVRTSEYASSNAITVTDVVPNGICPLLPAGTNVIGTMPSDCLATGTVTGGTIRSVTVNADGTFTMVFDITPATLAPNTVTHIVYSAEFRSNYDGGTVDPTASGDSFSNKASIAGTSTAIPATLSAPANVTPLTEPVSDGSGTTQASSSPTIQKEILPRTGVTDAADCEAHAGQYIDSTANGATVPNFVLGDIMCFQLQVNFSTTTDTRNAKITDFVPVGTTYDGYALGTLTDGSTVPAGDIAAPTIQTPADGSSPIPTWMLGHTEGSDTTNLFVTKGETLIMYVAATVTNTSPNSNVDITANLMKYSQANTAGVVTALRDQANFGVAPAPTVSLTKGITSVNSTVNTAPYPTTATIHGGDVVSFSLSATNTGTSALGNNQSEENVNVWDALPSPIVCSEVSLISQLGTCTDNFSGLPAAESGDSVIQWNLPGLIAAGASTPALTYTVTLPSSLTVSTTFTNNASVTAFDIANSAGGTSTFYPANSLDFLRPANTTAANASASITTPDVTVLKTVTSPVVNPNNSASQAVEGEMLTYTYSTIVPAHTTVYNGTLVDTIPAGLSVTSGANDPVSATESDNLPTGSTTAYASGAYTSSFPTTYTNTTASPQTFTVTLTNVDVTLAITGSISNTAKFNSNATLGGTALPTQQASASINIIRPVPTITNPTPTGTASAGSTLTYTVTVNNTAGDPAGYDSTLYICVPTGLTYGAVITPLPTGVAQTGTETGTGTGFGQDGCATTSEKVSFSEPTLLPSTPVALKFTATVNNNAAGSNSYAIPAVVTTSTISDGGQNLTEGIVSANQTANVTINGATVTKYTGTVGTQTSQATLGQSTNYTISAVIPANVNFYSASIIDTFPSGDTLDATAPTITCTDNVTSADCTGTLPVDGTKLTASGGKIGWYFGDLTSDVDARTITITYGATVTANNAANVAGTTETNKAQLGWNTATGTTPPNAAYAFAKSTSAGATATVTTTVTAPAVSVTKTVDKGTPAPGDTFKYTVNVSNSNAANSSAAYNVTVTDTPPTGVIVDPLSISNSGTITGQTANGGGTISWTLAGPIATNATVALTYNGTLAASGTLGTSGLTNTANITGFDSLASSGRHYAGTGVTPEIATSTVTPKFPAITIAKTPTSGTVAYANKSFGWTLKMTNGSSAGVAGTVVPTDVLPKNWTYDNGSAYETDPTTGVSTQVDPTSKTITGGVQTLIWSAIGPFAAGASSTITYTATPSSAALTTPGVGSSTPHTNTLSAVTTDATGATANSVGSYTVNGPVSANAFIGSADVKVTKTAGTDIVAGGGVDGAAWTITVTNKGNDPAAGPFHISDNISSLPTGINITGASGTGWTCSNPDAGGNFTCDTTNGGATLASGSSLPVIKVAASADPSVQQGTNVVNSATVSDATYDPILSNNTDTATATVDAQSDLQIIKTTSGTLRAGQTATWTLAVSDNGPSDSVGTTEVTDTLQDGLTNITGSGTGWTCSVSGQTLTCDMTDLTVATAAPEITVTADIPADYDNPITNSATVTSPNTDTNPLNNVSTVTNPVDITTSLTTQKTLTSGDLVAGEDATYRIDVNNTGTADARNVEVVDVLPDGLTYDDNVVNIGSRTWHCSETSVAPSTVTCDLAGNLAAASGSDTASFSFNAAIPSDTDTSMTITNSETASADNAPNVSDHVDGSTTGLADLSVTKSHPAGTIYAGENIVYTLIAKNNGPTDENSDTVITDNLPEGMTASSATGSGNWTCSINSAATIVTCDDPNGLTSGQSSPALKVTAHVASEVSTSTLYNNAVVTSSSNLTDTDLDNNSVNDPTVITTSADVEITKSGDAQLVPGTDTSYTITVTNNGPSDAQTAILTDTLPTGITGVNISGAGWTCDNSTLSCQNNDLSVGTHTLTVIAHVNADVLDGTTLENSASISWVDSSGTSTKTATADGTTATSADIVLTKTAEDTTAKAGTNTTFDLSVANNGPSDAVGPITVVDTLPAEMSFAGSTGSWDCSLDVSNSQKVDCTLQGNAGIANAGTAPLLKIEVAVASDAAAGSITNTATASSGTTDPDLTNNTDTASVTVGQESDIALTDTLSGIPRIGNPLHFNLKVHNNGPSDAQNVVVTDRIPAGLDNIDTTVGTDPAWTCVIGATDPTTGTLVTCTLTGTLLDGADAPNLEITGTVEVGAYPSVTDDANVTTSTPETTLTNNAAAVTAPIPAMVGLNLTKTHTGNITAGGTGTYLLTVTNNGMTEEPNAYTVTDTLPNELSYKSYSGTGVTCTDAANIVTCVFAPTLAVGDTTSVTLLLNVTSTARGTIVNTAAVSTPDEQVGGTVVNASDSGTITVPPPPAPILGITGQDLPIVLIIITLIGIAVGLTLRFTRFGKRKAAHRA